MVLEDDGHCFACGLKNPWGLKLSFVSDGESVKASFTPEKAYQGYKGLIHGGIITTVLDEAMAKAVIESGIFPITAELTVRFKEPLFVGEATEVTARIDKAGDRLIEASADLKRLSDNRLIAVAKGKLLRPD